jgi:hypothetical protein
MKSLLGSGPMVSALVAKECSILALPSNCHRAEAPLWWRESNMT